ncbi:MAG: hypothetical protein BZ136_00425 [Methanosphaera sp. rholeuAM74]|nr:MAG: hypothetical protein BZ136_00425 [Methanosphaera sp. rholeuAM74]
MENKTEEDNIYHHINKLQKQQEEKRKTKEQNIQLTQNVNAYIVNILLAIIIYITTIWISQLPITEIIDLELPLLILFSLIITIITTYKSKKAIYPIYLIVIILTYQFNTSVAYIMSTTLISSIIIDCINMIHINNEDYHNIQTTEKDDLKNEIISYFHRIKYHILLALIVFISFTILSYFYPTIFQSLMKPAMQQMQQGVRQGTVSLETIPLFINNFTVALNMEIGGIFLSVQTIFLLIYNALLIGYTGASLPLGYFLSFTLPHGIIELTAIILAGAGGFRITQAIIHILNGIDVNNKEKFSKHLTTSFKMVIDSIILLGIILVMLIIAAYIEANLTIPIGQTLLSI